MDIYEATDSYEKWTTTFTATVARDLEFKHEQMRASLFAFLRATFYRWVQLWPAVCSDLAAAPRLLAVGDLHVENFGSWRDREGRLIWGINDVDEAYAMPYTIDLVRLAASAHLAKDEQHLKIHHREASEAILEGYQAGLESRGGPFVLEEHHQFLRQIALAELRDPVHFWEKMQSLPDLKGRVPAQVCRELEKLLPERHTPYRLKRRRAGLGSLGRTRVVALATWRGALVAREAKALVPSACLWASGRPASRKLWCGEILRRAVRVPDPFVVVKRDWLFRRLSPHCSRIELSTLPKEREEEHLLLAMGRETANLHLGSRTTIRAVRQDLKKRRGPWLHGSARDMAEAIERDWQNWQKGPKS